MREGTAAAFKNLAIPEGNRTILSLDGGGIRGMLTIQLLKALEAEAGLPCHQLFDMVAGTSTGGIIAGLIATQHTAEQIETLYESLVAKVFVRRDPLAHQFLNPPVWSKASYRKLLKELLANVTLRQASDASGLDVLVTAQDVVEGEETFFSFLRGRKNNVYGDVLLRAAMESTMSAPTYFTPLERFVDGGTTTHNSPALASVLEAVQYGNGQYQTNKLSVFSFGTGCVTQVVTPEQIRDPKGPDAYFWLKWLMAESGNDATDMQDDVLRAKQVVAGLDYRRFQVSLDTWAMQKLPDLPLDQIDATKAASLSDLSDKELGDVALDNVAYMPVMKVIGEALVTSLKERAKKLGRPTFASDLIDEKGRELFVTRCGGTEEIAAQMSDPNWVDSQPT